MNRYRLVSNTGKRLVCQTFNDAARIQKKLAGRGVRTTMHITRGRHDKRKSIGGVGSDTGARAGIRSATPTRSTPHE